MGRNAKIGFETRYQRASATAAIAAVLAECAAECLDE
jgi:hypothetical protein